MRTLVTASIAILAGLYVLARFVPVEPIDRRPGLGLMAPAGAPGDGGLEAVAGMQEIHLETRPWYGIPHSVTTVIWRDGEHLYVPCKACALKSWPKRVAADPGVRLKINGRLYDMRAEKIEDDAERRHVLRVFGAADAPQDVWAYRMVPL